MMIIMHVFISQHYSCIKSHEHSLDAKVLFIAGFWNRNNTLTNNTAQNNNKQKSISPIRIKKCDCSSVNIHEFLFWE